MNRPRFAPRPCHLLAALLVAALALASVAPAVAKGSRRRPHRRAAVAAAPAPAPTAAGVVVAVDPETGRLGMPTAAQMLELTAAERTGLLHTAEGLTPVVLPDGSVMVDLQGRFMTFATLRLDPLGAPAFGWADDEAALRRTLVTPAPAAAPEER